MVCQQIDVSACGYPPGGMAGVIYLLVPERYALSNRGITSLFRGEEGMKPFPANIVTEMLQKVNSQRSLM
jgi:hypothetical protein